MTCRCVHACILSACAGVHVRECSMRACARVRVCVCARQHAPNIGADLLQHQSGTRAVCTPPYPRAQSIGGGERGGGVCRAFCDVHAAACVAFNAHVRSAIRCVCAPVAVSSCWRVLCGESKEHLGADKAQPISTVCRSLEQPCAPRGHQPLPLTIPSRYELTNLRPVEGARHERTAVRRSGGVGRGWGWWRW